MCDVTQVPYLPAKNGGSCTSSYVRVSTYASRYLSSAHDDVALLSSLIKYSLINCLVLCA